MDNEKILYYLGILEDGALNYYQAIETIRIASQSIQNYIVQLEQQVKEQKEVIDKAKSLNHEISHTIYEDFLEENIIGSKFLYERIKKQLSILEDKEVSE